ncbi:MAG: hypothetical protein ABIP95_12685 [Pelobium sp.]
MNKKLLNSLILVVVITLCLTFACSSNNAPTAKFKTLIQLSVDSVNKADTIKRKYASHYDTYLKVTTNDSLANVEKIWEYTRYPYKMNLTKEKVIPFVDHILKTIETEKDYKSAFGELSNIGFKYEADFTNYAMADLLTCKVVAYDLKNTKGKKIKLDDDEVSISKNDGSVIFSLAKWDLQGQHIKGNVTLEISVPYHIVNVDVHLNDKNKTLVFGDTKIDIIEMQNNALHYEVKDDEKYNVDYIIDSCGVGSTANLRVPSYFYQKLRNKPNLGYNEFLKDSVYFELGKKWKEDKNRVKILYFYSRNPSTVHLYGYKKTEMITKQVTIPIDEVVVLNKF